MTLTELSRSLSPEAAAALKVAPASVRREVLDAYQAHGDNRGRGRCEITSPPMAGSSKYPWLKRK